MRLAAAVLTLAALTSVTGARPAQAGAVTLRYFGHAFFLIVSGQGTRVATDPFVDVGYPLPEVEADAVTISHEVPAHNNAGLVKGSPRVLRGLEPSGRSWSRVEHALGDVRIKALPGYHDKVRGRDHGLNAVFLVEASGVPTPACVTLSPFRRLRR